MPAVLLAVAFGTAPSAAPGTGRDGDPALRASLARSVRLYRYPGALAQARRRGRADDVALGVADVRSRRAPRADMRFRAASNAKTFVATVILQLVAEGRLRLDDTVERWLPGLVRGNGNDGGRITVRMLLNHTSGLFGYNDDAALNASYERNPAQYLPPRDLVRVAVAHRPLFAPGTSWAYADTNYVLLGMLIRRVTGRSYPEEIERRVIRPLGLRATYFPGRSRDIRPPLLRGYARSESGALEDRTDANTTFAPASGDLISTVGDLARFESALLGGRLLPAALLRQMLAPVPGSRPYPDSDLDRYGMGVVVTSLPCGVTVYGNGGTLDGYLSGMAGTSGGAHTVAWVVNGSWGDQAALADGAHTAEFCRGSGPAPSGSPG